MLIKIFLVSVLIIITGTNTIPTSQERELRLSVQITTHNSHDTSLTTQYSDGERVFIKLNMINDSADEAIIAVGQAWRYIRPQLKRNGESVDYKKEMQELLIEGSPLYSPVIVVRLKPHTPEGTDDLNLEEWYDKLKAGHYQLSVGRIWGSQTFVSNTIEFDVVP